MRHLFLLLLVCLTTALSAQQRFSPAEIAQWEKQAKNINIFRDSYGVPHIYGLTDADAVFGVLYTQCEDDFDRVEMNYIVAAGRQAEVDGEAYLYTDLRQLLFLDTLQAIKIYNNSPDWMKKLLNAFADGANYYLYKHPEVKPKLIQRFQPWMPLMFSEGSIGGNISAVPLDGIRKFYGKDDNGHSYIEKQPPAMDEPTGSNGFAIAPRLTVNNKPLLLINPHTSFYFRSEVHMISKEGLNAYGAVTWGQFFIYQGFNENCGWMHTSSQADVMDEYLETIVEQNGRKFYRHGNSLKPLRSKVISLAYKKGDGMARKTFTAWYTHHGPVIGEQDGKWVAMAMMNEPFKALAQSYLRTKAGGYKDFLKVSQLRTNSSNNTVFADKTGNIAYWHGNFMPRRDPAIDWNRPVDGSDPRTDWKGLHPVKDVVQLLNPTSGWIQNCNSTPFTASGSSSPVRSHYPAYMAPDGENFRGIHAVKVLSGQSGFTLDKLIAAAFDPQLPGFEKLIPPLVQAYQSAANPSPTLREPIQLLQAWDYRYNTASIATTLAIVWAEKLIPLARPRVPAGSRMDDVMYFDFMATAVTPQEKLDLLQKALDDLTQDFGAWRMPWGAINRFQRLTGKIDETYDDNQPSIPVAFTASNWGSLAAYGARTYPGTKKRYGYRGNSFVAVVEFGDKVVARSIVTGGQDSRPGMKHFNDQSEMFCNGQFKEVRFYPEDVRKYAEKIYQPGDEN